MKIWAFFIPIYWIIALCAPTLANSQAYPDLMIAQILFFLATILPFLSGEHLLLALITFYYYITDMVFGNITATQHVIETCIFFSWWVWLKRRPTIETKVLNPYTIHLGFYKGDNATLKMNIAELFDLRAKSVCVIARDKALRIKDGVFAIVPATSVNLSGRYLVIDTGVVAEHRFIVEMMKFRGVVAEKHFLYSPCLCIIKELLALIGPEYSPSSLWDYIPSIYLRKVLKNGRKKNR